MRIVYVCPFARIRTGGVKMIFRHVEMLRDNGLPAVVATPDATPPTWFQTNAPVIAVDDIVRGSDAIVLPETRAEFLRQFAGWENRKVVFCQSTHLVYRGLGGAPDYSEFGVDAIICPSHAAANYCRRRFPGVDLFLVPYPLDTRLFRGSEPKRLQIAFMPSKRALEAAVIADLFRAENPVFRSIPWIELAGFTETQMAQILGETAVYLSLSRFDSFGLATLEAMSCGCVVAGFTGFGGMEYAASKNGFWAQEDDCFGCTDQLKRAVELATRGGDQYRDVAEWAIKTAEQYSLERFKRRLLATWETLTAGAFAAPSSLPDEERALSSQSAGA